MADYVSKLSMPLGQRYSRDQQCQYLLLEPRAKFAGDLSTICSGISCYSPTRSAIVTFPNQVFDFTTCGNGMVRVAAGVQGPETNVPTIDTPGSQQVSLALRPFKFSSDDVMSSLTCTRTQRMAHPVRSGLQQTNTESLRCASNTLLQWCETGASQVRSCVANSQASALTLDEICAAAYGDKDETYTYGGVSISEF